MKSIITSILVFVILVSQAMAIAPPESPTLQGENKSAQGDTVDPPQKDNGRQDGEKAPDSESAPKGPAKAHQILPKPLKP